MLQLACLSPRIQYESWQQIPRLAGCEALRVVSHSYGSDPQSVQHWLPSAPAGGPDCRVHRCCVRRCPRSVKITFYCCAGGELARCQNLSCNRNKLSKCVTKARWSSKWGMACDAISAKLLSEPATCVTLTGAEYNIHWRSANPLIRWCAALEFAVLVAILVNHTTLGVLSQ